MRVLVSELLTIVAVTSGVSYGVSVLLWAFRNQRAAAEGHGSIRGAQPVPNDNEGSDEEEHDSYQANPGAIPGQGPSRNVPQSDVGSCADEAHSRPQKAAKRNLPIVRDVPGADVATKTKVSCTTASSARQHAAAAIVCWEPSDSPLYCYSVQAPSFLDDVVGKKIREPADLTQWLEEKDM